MKQTRHQNEVTGCGYPPPTKKLLLLEYCLVFSAAVSHLYGRLFHTLYGSQVLYLFSYNKSQRDVLFFSNLFLIKNSTYFGQIYCPSSGVSTLYTQQQIFFMLVELTVCQHTVNTTSMTNTYCCVYSVETLDDGQQICPKYIEFFIKNKFEKQCISLAFVIRIYHDARSYECQVLYLFICLITYL